jgi:hypothetical protein
VAVAVSLGEIESYTRSRSTNCEFVTTPHFLPIKAVAKFGPAVSLSGKKDLDLVSRTRNTAFADQPAPIRPDPKLTPGATFDVTLQDISEPGYSKKVRNVTGEVKREVYAEYGITEHKRGEYEVDHLIPLSIGGSNSIKNLWPESYRTVWNAHVKDRLEDRLHVLVVS